LAQTLQVVFSARSAQPDLLNYPPYCSPFRQASRRTGSFRYKEAHQENEVLVAGSHQPKSRLSPLCVWVLLASAPPTGISMTGSWLVVATTISSALLLGFIPALWARIRTAHSECLGCTEAACERLRLVYLVSLIPLLPILGWAVDRWGARQLIFAGGLFAALGIALLGVVRNGRSALAVALILGAATSCLATACPFTMPAAFLGEDDRAASVNLGFVAVGLGFLLLPSSVELLILRFGFRRSMLLLALLALAPAVLTVFTSGIPDAVGTPELGYLPEPSLWLAAMVMFLYFPLESSLCKWSRSYLTNLGYTDRQMFWWLGGFWIFFLGARLVAAWLFVPGYEAWVVLALTLIAAITLGNLGGAYGQKSGPGLLLMGGWYGPILPTLLAVAMSFHATAVGGLLSLGTASSLVFASTASRFPAQTPRADIKLPLILALVMAAPTLLLALLLGSGTR
jgi:hypothetical protein